MKNEKILNAMGKISDELIEDGAITTRSSKRNFRWKALIASAACFCLLLTAVFSMLHFSQNSPAGNLPGVTNPTSPTAQGNNNSLNYGQVNLLSALHKTDTRVSGESFRYIAGTRNPGGGISTELAMPTLEFLHGLIHVVAKAVEDLGVYEELYTYGSSLRPPKYRLFRMEVTDPLQSGMEGTFYYLLPEDLTGDLTQFDALLISMSQLPKNFVLRSGDELTAFDYLFCDPQDAPELGNIIAFTDGVFDETLWETWWQDRSSRFGYQQYLRAQLDEEDDSLLVFRGTTLVEALQRRQAQIQEWDRLVEWDGLVKYPKVKHYAFHSEAARQAMAYWKPFENGIFVPADTRPLTGYRVSRYINGCPTNEWYYIDSDKETVTTSEYHFEDRDFEKLPDIATYIASLDLAQIAPQHTDTAEKVLIYNSAVGWYEKTENGVYSIVRIAWQYCDQDHYYVEYYDETFILLDETGDHIVSREDLIELIGENRNIFDVEYGVGIEMPMV